MNYSSIEFLLFFAVSFIFYLIFKKARYWILLFSSLVFYLWSGWLDFIIFFGVVCCCWLSVVLAHRFPKFKKPFVFVGILITLVHLFYWKYATWFVSQIQVYVPTFLEGRAPQIPLPIGISFITLQGIAYMVDYLRGSSKCVGFIDFLQFKSFFPQLVAGPIVRSKQLIPQIQKLRNVSAFGVNAGLTLFIFGFAKKIGLADNLGVLIDPIFRSPEMYNRKALILAMIGYTTQIYCDFSGYTDMGRGVARMMGFRLPENFLSPYFAESPSDFWRRWHITLSQWIRDYLYIPFGGNKGGFWSSSRNVFFSMAISGLWHGANWTFVVWGVYHATLIFIEKICNKFRVRIFNRLTTLGFVMVGWLIFRAENLNQFFKFFKRTPGVVSFGDYSRFVWVSFLGVLLWQIFNLYHFERKSRKMTFRILYPFLHMRKVYSGFMTVAFTFVLAGLFYLSLSYRLNASIQNFIYFQF